MIFLTTIYERRMPSDFNKTFDGVIIPNQYFFEVIAILQFQDNQVLEMLKTKYLLGKNSCGMLRFRKHRSIYYAF